VRHIIGELSKRGLPYRWAKRVLDGILEEMVEALRDTAAFIRTNPAATVLRKGSLTG
jgi:hypothetical protein